MSVNIRVKQRLQAALKQQSNGLLGLANLFKEYDTDNSGSLNWEEFCTALQKCGLTPSSQDIRALFLELDKDGNNEISYEEFIQAMRGDLSNPRKALITRVFESIDSDNDGVISMTDIGKCFNPKNHPDVRSGRKSVQNLIQEFFDTFGTVSNTGFISLDQFIEYYANTAAFDDDAKFNEMMKSLWTIRTAPNTTSSLKSFANAHQSNIGTLLTEADPGTTKNLDQLREQLISRGARGIVGLQRKFRIIDDDGSRTINLVEFKKAMKECNLALTELQLNSLFTLFDKDRSGSIDFNEFITGIRGNLNPSRKAMVRLAFNILDKDGSGEVDPEDLVSVYDASRHPEVLAGRRSADDVLREFLDTFDVGGTKDGKVTRDEFDNYYANISASIDDDAYFELMIRNAWHISGGEGSAANSANRRVLVTHSDGSQSVQEIKNDLGLKSGDKAGMMARLRAQGVDAGNVSLFDGADNTQAAKAKSQAVLNRLSSNSQSANRGAAYQTGNGSSSLATSLTGSSGSDPNALRIATAGPGSGESKGNSTAALLANLGTVGKLSSSVPTAGLIHIITRLKAEMKTRGAAGFIGLQRKFRIMDDDGSKSLSLSEFKKAMKEMNMNLSDGELRMLFDYFDADSSSTIDFEEFIQGVRDPLSERRLRLVQMAFTKLDKDGNGCVDAEEVASMYDSSKHPEVLAGRKSPQEIMSEFLNTFDVGGVKDGMVTLGEFVNYYANLGANIDRDDYFELMIRNAWHISGGEGAAANSANRRVLVTRADGSQTVEEIQDDLGIKANDTKGMLARLNAQGVAAAQISLFDGGDDNSKNIPQYSSKPISIGSLHSAPKTQRPGPVNNSFNMIFGNTLVTPPQPPSREERIAASGPSARPVTAKATNNTFASSVLAPGAPSVSSGRPHVVSAINPGLALIVSKIKTEMKARGAAGFIGLQRKFRIMDDDGSKSLSLSEFKKAMKEMNMNLSDGELRMLFDHFDAESNGSVDFEEFIQGVRDPLTERRLALVKIAYSKLDKDGNGCVDAEEIASMYDSSKHPDVLSGKRSPNDILTEFLNTFDVGGVKDGMVTLGEFVNYYTNLGANIDRDDYFELMIRNAWHISGGEGAAANSANRRVLVTHSDGSQSVQEIKNDLGILSDNRSGIMKALRAQGVDVGTISLHDGGEDNKVTAQRKRFSADHHRTTMASGLLPGTGPTVSTVNHQKTKKDGALSVAKGSVAVRILVQRLKDELSTRGASGFVGLQRKFRIMDDDGSKTLSYAEFKKALKEMNMVLTDNEFRTLFDHFDNDSNGSIDFEEFIQGVRDPLTERRLALVKLAFEKIDTDGSGIVDAAELASKYDATRHPEVVAGRMTPEQVLTQFLDTFDVGGVKDGMVTLGEFVNYYTNLGANIDRDDYFELMIRNAWHISGGEGAAANSANRRVLVTRADGSQTVEEIKNDLGLGAKDTAGMMARLKAQGINAAQVSIYDGGDDNKQKLPAAPSRASTASNILGQKSVNLSSIAKLPNKDPSTYKATAGRLTNSESINGVIQPQRGAPSLRRSAPQASYGIQVLINKIKTEMKTRGAAGFIGLQRKFRIMDDDGSKSLSLSEFKKAMKEMNFELQDAELRALFDHFDADSSSTIDFEEFIQGVRDPLSERRLALVHTAFSILDKDGSGMVDADEIASMYDSSRHPEVITGTKTSQQVLTEFLNTFDVGGVKDGMVTLGEFVNYYTNLGANIDRDDYFELMIRNAWHISGGEGSAANSANRRVLVTDSNGNQSVQEIRHDLGLRFDDQPGVMSRLKAQGSNASQISFYGGGNNGIQDNFKPGSAPSVTGSRKRPTTAIPRAAQENHIFSHPTSSVIRPSTANSSLSGNSLTNYNKPQGKQNILSNNVNARDRARVSALLEDLRVQLAQRGARGIVGMQRKFRIMDDNGDHALSVAEFKKAMKECALNLSDEDMTLLFNYFDADQSKDIDFEEFLQGVKGPMSDRRRALVTLAFNVLDKDGSGEIDPEDIIHTYDSSRHPDVLSGKRTANDVLREFLDTFDVGGVKDGVVTRQEFENYYSNVGASIEDDNYFELMIRNAWHISGGEGSAANSANRRVLVTDPNGNQSVQEIRHDLGLGAKDTAGMMNRLRGQGLQVANISLYDGGEDNKKNQRFGTRPATASAPYASSAPSPRNTNLVFGGEGLARSVEVKNGRKNFSLASSITLG